MQNKINIVYNYHIYLICNYIVCVLLLIIAITNFNEHDNNVIYTTIL